MKLNELEGFPELGNTIVIDGIEYVKKREPLSDEEIYDRCCAMDSSYTCNFIDGVEWAEDMHGIGGGE
jgi:hypothetical protein